MSGAVISIGSKRRGCWSLLEIAQAGQRPLPFGVLLVDQSTGELTRRFRDFACFDALEEGEWDILTALPADLDQKAQEMGGLALLQSLEDSLSGFFRISDRESIAYSDANVAVDRLFDEHVDSAIRKFITHLPLYGLRAAATQFGEGMEAREEGWVRVPQNLRLTQGMFVARVVGRSMEPLIPDGSLCIFRAGAAGSRKGRFLLIELFGETDFASRYTVKRYARQGGLVESPPPPPPDSPGAAEPGV
jgi:phage repressor protein C with HTH and peptisase S24 domain